MAVLAEDGKRAAVPHTAWEAIMKTQPKAFLLLALNLLPVIIIGNPEL